MQRDLTADELRAILRERCDAAGSETKWAKANGFGQSFVSKVLRGETPITARLADALSHKMQVTFYACNPENRGA